MVAAAELEVVKPQHFWCPPYTFTAGDEVAGLCTDVGFGPDWNQSQALDVIFAETEQSLPAAFDVVVIGARQNIKTGLMKQATIGWLWLLGIRRVLYTAHDWNPACADMFRDMKNLVEGSSLLSRRVRRIYEGNGEESIEFMSGQQMLFKTRTKKGGVGAGFDKVIWDEGFALQHAHIGSLTPTQATKAQAQNLTGSSAGHEESEVLRELRDRGRPGGDPYLAYIEYCAPDPVDTCDRGSECDHGKRTPGCGCDKPEMWRHANPAVASGRVSLGYIARERAKMRPKEFGRERMGWWDLPAADRAADTSPLDFDRWEDLVDEDEQNAPAEMRTFAVEVDGDQAQGVIGAAGLREDGRTHVEFVTAVPVRRILRRSKDLAEDHGPGVVFAFDEIGPAADLIQDFRDAGLTVRTLNTREVGKACADLTAAINDEHDESIVHGPEPELDIAIEAARKRKLGGDGSFAFRRDVEALPLLAVALAKFALEHPDAGEVSIFGFGDLDMCDQCGENEHEDPDGEHDYLCPTCRPEDEED